MKKIEEMNNLESAGAKDYLRKAGWTPCLIGGDITGWSKDKITIPQKEIYFEEEN